MVVAENAAAQRAAEYRVWCAEQEVPYITLFTKEELGRRIGKTSRSAVGLLNPHFRVSFCATLTLLQTLEASLDFL
jgi:ribosomal protein L7Ae-like RNA K-turn-binding protein